MYDEEDSMKTFILFNFVIISGGTVLSTNWGEVSKKDYEKERQAPKGMEWRNWEGNKVPQVDNND